MRQTCEKLDEKGMLYEVCTRFSGFDLGPETVSDRMMTDIYEHLIQRYGEEISQDAEDFMTPKDVARLATALLFANEDTLLNADNGDIRTLLRRQLRHLRLHLRRARPARRVARQGALQEPNQDCPLRPGARGRDLGHGQGRAHAAQYRRGARETCSTR